MKVCTVLFLFELILRVAAHGGLKNYFGNYNWSNRFDFLIVTLSVVSMVVSIRTLSHSVSQWFTASLSHCLTLSRCPTVSCLHLLIFSIVSHCLAVSQSYTVSFAHCLTASYCLTVSLSHRLAAVSLAHRLTVTSQLSAEFRSGQH